MATLSRCVRLLLLFLLILPHAAAEAADVLFPPDAVINVKDYGALPDDQKDDTQAIQKAITDHVGTGRTIYFPAGTYDLSDTMVAKNKDGKWEAHLTLQGQGRDKTILRLRNNAAGFGDPKRPKALIMTGSHWQTGDSEDGGGNKAFRNNIRDLTILTSIGNPGAIGIEWAVSNQGTIRDVEIQSGDKTGVAGIALNRRIPGPGLIVRVTVSDFDVAVNSHDIQYGLTIADMHIRSQEVVGLRTTKNLLHICNLHSVNQVPVVQLAHGEAVATILNSYFKAPRLNLEAVDAQKGSVFIRNVEFVGYRADAFRCGPHHFKNMPAAQGADWSYAGAQIAWPPPMEKGAQPVMNREPLLHGGWWPEPYWSSNLGDWQPVGPRLPGEADDTAAIQRAIDAGKPVVYFPIRKDAYFLGDTVTIRGKVRHVLGMGQEISLGAAEKPFSNRENPRPLFRIDPVDGDDVTIENCFFNAQYPGEVIFENNSPKTLVIKHCLGWVGSDKYRRSYQNTPASFGGKVFIEDCFLPGWRFEKQDVWARQFNPENMDGDGNIPQVANIGGTLWILGFKTEGPAPFIHTSAGGTTELLGAYNYISATHAPRVPEDAVPYICEDSKVSLTFATDNFRPDSDYKVYIREVKDGKVIREVPRDQMPPRNGVKGDRSFVMTNYRSQ